LHDAQISEGFESDELKTEDFKTKEDLVIENLPAFQINIPAEIPMVNSFNSSRNNLAHLKSFDREDDFSKITKKLNFSNSCQVKMVKPPSSMFAYPSQYNMNKYLSSSNPGSFNYDVYKKEARSKYTSILEKSLPMEQDYVPLRKERLSSTQNITVGRPYIKNYPSRYYAEPLSQRSHSKSTHRVKPLRRKSPSLENSRVDLYSSLGSFRKNIESAQYQKY